MQEAQTQQPGQRGFGQAAIHLAALAFAALETLAERRYAAPWRPDGRPAGRC